MPRANGIVQLCPCHKCKSKVLYTPQTIKKHLEEDRLDIEMQGQRYRPTKRQRFNDGGISSDQSNGAVTHSPVFAGSPICVDEDKGGACAPNLLASSATEISALGLDVLEEGESVDGSDDPIPDQSIMFRNLLEDTVNGMPRFIDDSDLLNSDDETPVDLRNSTLHDDENSPLDDEENALDIDTDPLFRSRDAIFDDEITQDSSGRDQMTLPLAFDEDPILRNIYIRIFAQAAFKGATHDAVHDMLQSEKMTLLALQQRGILDYSLDLSKMATTLRTIERRLGVSPDDYITYYFICPTCWARHHPSELCHLLSPECNAEGCDGRLYTTVTGLLNIHGKQKRVPTKILPYSSLIGYIRRMFLRPGKAEEVEHWRKLDDYGTPHTPAISKSDWCEQTYLDQELCDIHDGFAWRSIKQDLTRLLENSRRRAYDASTDTPYANMRFVSRYLGLLFTINIDWFQPMAGRVHSTGALYLTVNNLPRAIRNLRENTFLLCVIPGPHEPSKEQINVIIELLTGEIELLSKGIEMTVLKACEPEASVHSDSEDSLNKSPNTEEYVQETELVSGLILNNCSDTPARAKTSGLAASGSEDHFCPICDVKLSSITTPSCFDPTTFQFRDPEEQLFWKLIAKTASQDRRDRIAASKGVRYSPLDDIPNWFAATSSPVDPMHCILIGITSHVHKTIIFNGGMFEASRKRGSAQPVTRFEEFMDSIWWPGWVARVPPKVSKGNGKIKADQWRNLISVYAVAIFVAWRNDDDKIPNQDAPKPSKTKNTSKASSRSNKLVAQRRLKLIVNEAASDEEIDDDDLEEAQSKKASRNYEEHYSPILNFLAGCRITLSQKITRYESKRAQDFFGRAFRTWARLGCHLTPNFHSALHIHDFIEQFGPVYGWWVYAFERMNGVLSRFKINGHGGGELEATMLRGWIKSIQLQQLVAMLQMLPNKTEDDKCTINILLAAMKGGAESERARGTFLNYLASISSTRSADAIELPVYRQTMDLQTLLLYDTVLKFVRQEMDHNILSFSQRVPRSTQCPKRLYSTSVFYPTLQYAGQKYGSSIQHRGKRYCYGYIESRHPCIIDYLFTLNFGSSEDSKYHCAVVRRFTPEVHESPPWNTHAVDLGISMWSTQNGPQEVVLISQLNGHFAWAPIMFGGRELRVTFSLDHRQQEPDVRDVSYAW